nr:uncharacterized protein LOC111751540 [Loxodonta africana]
MPIEALALKKKISRMVFDPAVCAILSSLLLYITDHVDGPQGPPPAKGAGGKENQVNRRPEPQEPYKRPTKFQLLQSKFMNTNREPYIKKTREVGRLIFKDKQGPSRSFVNTTINKLLEKTTEKVSSPEEEKKPFSGEKPRWSHPTGKSTVKNILKMFLAAEEKEAKEKEAREKPPAGRPKASRAILPKIVRKKNSVLSKLREKFEQSSSLCSEASVLLLRKEERKKKNLQRKKMHRPEIQVLHTATMASTCIKTPLVRYLACTAEPVQAFSIATIVCSPRCWLSHCTKISHSKSRSMPGRETSLPSNAGAIEPDGNKVLGKGQLGGENKGPLKATQSLTPKVTAHQEDQAALKMSFPSAGPDCLSMLDSYSAFCESKALLNQVPVLSPLNPASQRSAGLAGCHKTMGLRRESAAEGVQEAGSRVDFPHFKEARATQSHGPPSEGAGEIPQMTMAVCSSEDEIESTPSSERDPFFAIQKYFPEQKVPEHIPPLNTPAVQAAWRTQSAIEPPQITVKLPVVYEMPTPPVTLQNSSSSEDKCTHIFGGENVIETAQTLFPIMTENKRYNQATVKPSKLSGMPAELDTSSQQGSQAALKPIPLRGAASFDRNIPETVLTPKPQKNSTGEKEKHSLGKSNTFKDHKDISREDISELSYEKHQLPESTEMPTYNNRTSSNYSTTSKNSLRGNICSTSGSQQLPSSSERNSMAVSTLLAACQQLPSSSERNSMGVSTLQAACQQLPSSSERNSMGVSTLQTARQQLPSSSERNSMGVSTLQTARQQLPSSSERNSMGVSTLQAACQQLPSSSERNSMGVSTLQAACQQLPSSSERNSVGVSTLLAAPSKDCIKSESFTMMDKSILCEQEEYKRPPLTEFAQPLKIAEGNSNHLTRNKPSSLNELSKPSIKASEEMRAMGSIKSHAIPSPGNTVIPENNMGEALNTFHQEEYRIPSTRHFVTKGNSFVGEDLPREPNKHHFLAPSGPSKHKNSRAAERSILSDTELCPSSTPEYLTTHLTEAANTHLVFDKPLSCVSNELTESKNNAAVESKNNIAMEGKPLGNNLKCQILTSNYSTPQENRAAGFPCHTFGKQQLPSLNQQVKDKVDTVTEKQPWLGTESFHQFPTMPSTEVGVKCVNRASLEQKYPSLQTRLLPSTSILSKHKADVPEEKNLGNKAEESLQMLGNLGSQENHHEQKKNTSSNVGLPQTQQPNDSGKKKTPSLVQKAMLHTAKKPQTLSSNDLAENEKVAPEVKNSSQSTEKRQEHLPGKLVKHLNNSTQNSGAQLEKEQSAPTRSPEKPGSLAAQGGTQAMVSKMAPHDLEQPLNSTAEVKPTAGKSRKYQRPAPSDGWKKEHDTHHKPKESQPNTSKNKASSPEELRKPYHEPMKASDSEGCQTPPISVKEGLPHSPGEAKDIRNKIDKSEHKQQRRLAHFAKYRAQSFSDQKSFELSFGSRIIKANDTLEFPK